MRSAHATAEYLRTNLAHWDRYGFGLWVIFEEGGRFVGRAGIRRLEVEGVDEIEIAYSFRRDAWGLGYASETAAALRDVAFGALGLEGLVAIAVAEHGATRAG